MQRFDFASDNTAGICPEALAAVHEENYGATAPYGDDALTAKLRARLCEIFETDCESFLVFNGTAANALALAHVCQPFHSVVCHELAHIATDECGACEFFGGGLKLLPAQGENGKLEIASIERVLAQQHGIHSHQPRAISLTQATELGTLYRPNEIWTIAQVARQQRLLVHLDGARFANALGALACSPAEISWKAGVDVLCLGGTKNGLAASDLVIFFQKELSADFVYRMKQAGQLASKMRLLAAQWLGLVSNENWMRNARRANQSARELATKLREQDANIVYPVESNAVFFRAADDFVARMNARGWMFYKFVEPDIYRLMCSWATTEETIDDFAHDFARASCANAAR